MLNYIVYIACMHHLDYYTDYRIVIFAGQGLKLLQKLPNKPADLNSQHNKSNNAKHPSIPPDPGYSEHIHVHEYTTIGSCIVLLEATISDCRSLYRSKHMPIRTLPSNQNHSREHAKIQGTIKHMSPIKASLLAQLFVHQSPHAEGTSTHLSFLFLSPIRHVMKTTSRTFTFPPRASANRIKLMYGLKADQKMMQKYLEFNQHGEEDKDACLVVYWL